MTNQKYLPGSVAVQVASMLWQVRFFSLLVHKRLDGVFDKDPKESMACHLLRSPLFETRQNESSVDRSLRVGVR